jgi:hypothetical protein
MKPALTSGNLNPKESWKFLDIEDKKINQNTEINKVRASRRQDLLRRSWKGVY